VGRQNISARAVIIDGRAEMTITPTPEQERILAKAIKTGLVRSPEEALNVGVETLRARLATDPPRTKEEWLAEFHEWIDSHSWQTVVLSDEAMSRDSIYPDRS
jgi:hypothetical protein